MHQEEIARSLGIFQSAVSQRIEKIRQQTQDVTDAEKVFWTILLGAGAIYLLQNCLKRNKTRRKNSFKKPSQTEFIILLTLMMPFSDFETSMLSSPYSNWIIFLEASLTVWSYSTLRSCIEFASLLYK